MEIKATIAEILATQLALQSAVIAMLRVHPEKARIWAEMDRITPVLLDSVAGDYLNPEHLELAGRLAEQLETLRSAATAT